MFNRDFYPTPDSVIERMLFPVDIRGKVILEPMPVRGKEQHKQYGDGKDKRKHFHRNEHHNDRAVRC